MNDSRQQKIIAIVSLVAIAVLVLAAKVFSTITINHRAVMPFDVVSYKITDYDTSGVAISTTTGGAVLQGAAFSPNINIDETRNHVIAIELRSSYDTISYDFDYFSSDSQIVRPGRRIDWKYNADIDSAIIYVDSAFVTSNRIYADTIRTTDGDAAADSLSNRRLFTLPRYPGRVASMIRVYSYMSDGYVGSEDIPTYPGIGTTISGGGTSPWTEYDVDSLFSLVNTLLIPDSGAGLNAVTLYFIDSSSSPDSIIASPLIAVRNAAGSALLWDLKASMGGVKTVMLDNGSYTVRAAAGGYYFDLYSLTVSGDDDSVAVFGYGATLRNHAYIYGDAGPSNKYGLVYVDMPDKLNNVCDSILAPKRHWAFQVGSDGLWGGYVPYSSCFNDKPYTVTLVFDGNRSESITVPDTSVYKVFWQ